jgi:hypothetical protein
MDKQIVEKINGGRYKFFLAITGGGTSFIGDYIKMGGASKVLVGAMVPYHQKAFDKFIRGQKVDKYASSEGARKLAVASFRECLDAGIEKHYALGVGVSCSIASTSPEREGRQHKFFIATHRSDTTTVVELILNQGRTREEEEAIVSKMILERLALATEAVDRRDVGTHFPLKKGETLVVREPEFDELIYGLVEGHQLVPLICSDKKKADAKTLAIYSGSWNPLHEAHKAIHTLAEEILKVPVFLEFTTNNTDKGSVDYVEIEKRMREIRDYNSIITRAPHFRSKVAALREGGFEQDIVFVVGYDTWMRVWDQKYCLNNSIAEEEQFFLENNVKFLVFGRGGEYQPLSMDGLGEGYRIADPRAEKFQMNLSSSDIRKNL